MYHIKAYSHELLLEDKKDKMIIKAFKNVTKPKQTKSIKFFVDNKFE